MNNSLRKTYHEKDGPGPDMDSITKAGALASIQNSGVVSLNQSLSLQVNAGG